MIAKFSLDCTRKFSLSKVIEILKKRTNLMIDELKTDAIMDVEIR